MLQYIWQKLRLHWPLVVLALVGLVVLFLKLGKDYLWADEGDTAVFAANITKCALPNAWDGVTFVDSDRGARLNYDLVMVTSPWLQYYAAAASFLIFGENTFSARLPFAIAGLLTVLFAYYLVVHVGGRRLGAFCTAAMLVASVQFLIYCRQCRYYALSMLLTLLLIQIFLKMKSARHCALFALIAILLFHAHPIGSLPILTLGLLTIVYRPFVIQRRWFWTASPVIIAATASWAIFGGRGYAESMGGAQSIQQFSGRLLQFLIECASATPLLGVVIIAIFCSLQHLWNRSRPSSDLPAVGSIVENQRNPIIVLTFVTLLLYALTIAATQSADSLWRIGIRYATPMFPLLAMSAGILIDKISRGRAIIAFSLTFIFIFTKFAQLTPWIFWGKGVTSFDGKEVIEAHLPNNLAERFLNTRQQFLFLSDLFQDNRGTIANVSNFLREHAQPGDKIITNYEWEPLYFHTGLPQALKILPDYPIYQAAKSKQLPDYVFDVDQVRWVIWRPAWDGYQEYFAGAVQQQIADRGGRIERIAEVPETLWENRENIHFRRFSGGRYLFHGPENFPAASIFRVSWPDAY